jgi:UDP-N-acetyl-D-mannosaminuronic acid dehydrogenase
MQDMDHALTDRIQSRAAQIGIVGLGYAGLPVAAAFASEGFTVVGVDIDQERVAAIARGECPIAGEEPGLAELLLAQSSKGALRATHTYATLGECDVVLICVDTPINAEHKPSYTSLLRACESLGSVLKAGALVAVESTLAPGTMKNVVQPALERASGMTAGSDFLLGHCPERVMPGKLLHNLRTLDRCCGGQTESACTAMIALYRTIVRGALDATDCVTAELVKTAENAYRDVNIAFANELAMICEHTGSDFLQVRALVNKSPGRNVLLAGAGVGGHCIPKDSWLLSASARESGMQTFVLEAARKRNDAMPEHVLTLANSVLRKHGCELAGSTLVVLGYAYLENSGDARNSPSAEFVQLARMRGAEVRIHDPWVAPYNERPLTELLEGADCAVVMVAHDAYRKLRADDFRGALKHAIVVDGRDVFADADMTGMTYVRLGCASGRSAPPMSAPNTDTT